MFSYILCLSTAQGSSNSLQSTTHSKANKVQENTAKLDPLDMLREIYLDHNSKVITMLVPPSGTELGKVLFIGRKQLP